MDEKTLQAIKSIIDYMEADEQEHFEECEPSEQTNHIYNDIVKVRAWLDKESKV